MDSGYVTGHAPSFSDTGSHDASLQVTNSENQSVQSSFKINVIANDPSRDEPNDTFGTATHLDGEQAHLSWIQSTGDVDIYEVLTPDGKSLPYGTQVLATLRNLPADYDLAVIQDLGSDVAADSQVHRRTRPLRTPRSQALPTRPCPIRPCPTRPCPTRPCPTRPCPIRPCPTRPCPTPPCRTPPCPMSRATTSTTRRQHRSSSTRHTRRCHTRRCPSTARRSTTALSCTARPTPSTTSPATRCPT